MKALLAKIPRDRSLLLLLAPIVVLCAFVVAGPPAEQYSRVSNVDEAETSASTSTTIETLVDPLAGTGGSEQAADVAGTNISRSGTTSGSRGSGSSSTGSTSRAATGSSGSAPTSSVPDWVDGATTTTSPGETTSTTSSPTTTVPGGGGPDPVVNEVPVAILLPVTAVLVLCLGLFVISRRRRVRGA